MWRPGAVARWWQVRYRYSAGQGPCWTVRIGPDSWRQIVSSSSVLEIPGWGNVTSQMRLPFTWPSIRWTSIPQWDAVGGVIAAASLVVTIAGLIVAIVALIKQLRATYSVEAVWRFKDEWDRADLIEARRHIAEQLVGWWLNEHERPRRAWNDRGYNRLQRFFDNVESLIVRHALDAGAVWPILGDEIICWTSALSAFGLTDDESLADALGRDNFVKLRRRMLKEERKHLSRIEWTYREKHRDTDSRVYVAIALGDELAERLDRAKSGHEKD